MKVDKYDPENYRFQWKIKGAPCMLYWAAGGLCYFVDYQCNFMELASNQYRNITIGEALMDGILCSHKDKIIFVINDLVMKSSKSYRGAWLDERRGLCKKVIGNLKKGGPISICYNEPTDITENSIKNLKFKNELKLNGVQVPISGACVVPNEAKFQFSKNKPGYVWSPKKSKKNWKQFKSLVINNID